MKKQENNLPILSKIGILLSFVYTLSVAIKFFNNIQINSFLHDKIIRENFEKEVESTFGLITYVMNYEVALYSIYGLFIIAILFMSSQIISFYEKTFNKRNFFLSLLWFTIPALYLIFILWGH